MNNHERHLNKHDWLFLLRDRWPRYDKFMPFSAWYSPTFKWWPWQWLISPYLTWPGWDHEWDDYFILGFTFIIYNYDMYNFFDKEYPLWLDEKKMKRVVYDKEEYNIERDKQIEIIKRWQRRYLK